jgi:signal transduction histidine kinase
MGLNWFLKLSFRKKLIFNALLVSFVSAVILSSAMVAHDMMSKRSILVNQGVITAKLLSANAGAAVAFENKRSIADLLGTLTNRPEIQTAIIYKVDLSAKEGKTSFYRLEEKEDIPPPITLGVYSKSGEAKTPSKISFDEVRRFDENSLEIFEPIHISDKIQGMVFIRSELDQLSEAIRAKSVILAITLIFSIGFSIFLARIMQGALTKPIQELVTTINQVSKSKDYSIRSRKLSHDEIGELSNQFNDMLTKVQEADREKEKAALEAHRLNESLEQSVIDRTQELSEANDTLSTAMEDLQNAQSQLVENEKMASLGSLVAGVAHEINTPIGIGVTATSHLNSQIKEFDDLYQSGKIKKSDFETMLTSSKESSGIILKNLQRAAELIKSFKQVAVDQSEEQTQHFNLKTYLDDVIVSLKPQLKHTAHEFEIECEDVEVNSYPGCFAQIVTNLVGNSILHAFDDGRAGRMSLRVKQEGEEICLTFEDNGKGMTEEQLEKIYEPFFTTKRGKGGSGLGMHILYNMVSQTLNGTIDCYSEVGKGTKFEIYFPVDVANSEPTILM